jgi:ABC-type multidrug transport system fused ATPase/permease subunit
MQMGPGLSVINLGRSAGVNVFDTLLRQPLINPSSNEGRKLDYVKGKIEFRKVFFTYVNNPDKPIFYNFDLTIEPGQSVAL